MTNVLRYFCGCVLLSVVCAGSANAQDKPLVVDPDISEQAPGELETITQSTSVQIDMDSLVIGGLLKIALDPTDFQAVRVQAVNSLVSMKMNDRDLNRTIAALLMIAQNKSGNDSEMRLLAMQKTADLYSKMQATVIESTKLPGVDASGGDLTGEKLAPTGESAGDPDQKPKPDGDEAKKDSDSDQHK